MNLRGAFQALRVRNYRLWAGGAFVSNVGTWVQGTAQDWLVYAELTRHDASAMGWVMALQFAPQFLFLPWTGHAADRFNQRKLLMATQATMGALALALGALTLSGAVRLWHVYVFAFLFGVAAAFDAPVRQTFVAELVGDEDLHNAVALNSTSFNAARLIGPAVSGVVIASIGTGWAFLINGASFVAVLLSLALVRVSELRPSARAARARGGFVEGLAYVRRRPDLVAILAMLFLVGTFGLNFPIFISAMAVDVFHADARSYGILSSLMAVGSVAGALAGAGVKPKFAWLGWAAATLGGGFVLAAVAPGYASFAAALVAVGAALMVFTNATNTLMQLSTEPAMRGRVMALRVGVAMAGTPVGAPVVGWLADHFGPRWAMAAGAGSGFAAALFAVLALARETRQALAVEPPDGRMRTTRSNGDARREIG